MLFMFMSGIPFIMLGIMFACWFCMALGPLGIFGFSRNSSAGRFFELCSSGLDTSISFLSLVWSSLLGPFGGDLAVTGCVVGDSALSASTFCSSVVVDVASTLSSSFLTSSVLSDACLGDAGGVALAVS